MNIPLSVGAVPGYNLFRIKKLISKIVESGFRGTLSQEQLDFLHAMDSRGADYVVDEFLKKWPQN